jgi:hypothetical protein
VDQASAGSDEAQTWTKRKERPTRESMQAVRIAAEETRRASDELESGTFAARAATASDSDPAEVRMTERGLGDVKRSPVAKGADVIEADFSDLVLAEDEGPAASSNTSITAPPPPAAREISKVARRLEKQVPRMVVGMKDISKYPINPRAAFLLGYIDGTMTVEEIIDLCGMPSAEVLELVDLLYGVGVIGLG